MQEIIENLKSIGLEDKEAKIYVALLKFGEATVGDIADEAGIKRPTTYVILDELRKKGLVLKIPHAKKQVFQAKTPDEFFEQTVANVNQFEKILPKLRSMNPSKKTIKTLYFEGINGIKEAMYYRIEDLKNSVDEGFWAKHVEVSNKVVEVQDEWIKAFQKYNISIGGVTPDHESTRMYVERYKGIYKDFLFAPLEDYSADISIEVTKEFVRIIDAHDLKAIIIENPRVVYALGQIFKLAKEKYKK
ncbi:MAG: helix-turn-helix domain-containing protein [Patescibacteria group bacterium]